MRYAAIFPMLWVIFCIPLLALMALFGLGNKVPVTIVYSIFLFISYFDLRRNESKLSQQSIADTTMKRRSIYIAILSTASLLIIAICHIYGISWNLHLPTKKIPSWIAIFYPAAGAPIALITWFYVACRVNDKDERLCLLSKIEFYAMIIITYALSLSMDYSNFIIGHRSGMSG
jgi:hypothetical protein